jgi:branched-chain amino acid transport system ATP-binding protein
VAPDGLQLVTHLHLVLLAQWHRGANMEQDTESFLTGAPMTHALLEVKHLDKHFGGLHVLKDINITVQEGEIVGILGPNGAGKTTLFNLLTGFIPADEGQVLLRGKSLREMRSNDIVGLGVARTFQLCRPFVGLTVLENVLVGSLGPRVKTDDIGARAMHLLDQVGLGGKAHTASELLSYGDLRRLEIARALATDPELLLLDEPFAGLGSSEIEALSELIRKLHREQKLTIMLIEHKLREFMQLVSRVVAIDFGEVIAEGVPADIVNNPRVIEAYIGRQNPLEQTQHA